MLFVVSLSDVQDVNDNPPMFEQNEYTVKVIESTPNNSQVCIYHKEFCESGAHEQDKSNEKCHIFTSRMEHFLHLLYGREEN